LIFILKDEATEVEPAIFRTCFSANDVLTDLPFHGIFIEWTARRWIGPAVQRSSMAEKISEIPSTAMIKEKIINS
jgi:hypothetical protein